VTKTWWQGRKKLRQLNITLVRELKKQNELTAALQRQMANAGDFRFPDANAAYQRGWQDCLKYLNIPIQEQKGSFRNLPSTQARQSSITHRTNSD
jgi:hypothetical protein